jgi:cytochrome c biogenesis protein CcdA
MNENRVIQQVTAIFSVFMVFFYLGIGYYLIFLIDTSYIDKALRVILGATFIFYGIFRAYRAYVKIVEVFFTKNKDQD